MPLHLSVLRSVVTAALVLAATVAVAAEGTPPAATAPPASAAAPAATAPAPAPAPATLPDPVTDARRAAEAEGLVIRELKIGTGTVALPGMNARVHYTGWLYDPKAPEGKGRVFDSSRDRGRPFMFPVGGGRVIRGWDLGVAGMQPGGQRRLVIPAQLGYGDRGAPGVIPPGATLVFDVELLSLVTPR
ncbi:MAG: FKBP-type peptidyl-prolyl cis-trans isomerase [Steroidobacteraceae bacterium]|nr:FKBP-type peptidyl-prolyl cis-trans isomerase [Steroidobacteraceae bacterium]